MPKLPKLRADLTLSEQSTADGRVVIAKDFRTGRFFRMREVEAFIAERLDGRTEPATLRLEAERHFGGSLPEEVLRSFLATLAREGLLEGRPPRRAARPPRRSGFRGSLFYLRYPLFDPDRLLSRLQPWTDWMFRRVFIWAAALLATVAVVLVVANWSDLAREVAGLYQLRTVAAIVLTAFAIITAHELAHGMTCKRFGGEVREIGFILIYFQPAMYCNVSDAWLFPEKSKRLLVGLAGPGFELFLWSIATLLWRFSEIDTWVHRVALLVLAISGLKTLLNFNPFIKLDGYYLLSDYLEIPNLRRKSFRYVGDAMRRFFLGVPSPGQLPSRRERRIFAVYGAIASFASFAIAGFALVVSGTYFLDSHQPLALLVATGFLGLVSQRRVRSLFGGTSGSPEDGDTPSAQRGARTSGGRPDPVGSRRRWIWGIAAAAALGLSFFVHLELRIGGRFDVIPVGVTEVRATVEGVVDTVLVTEGGAIAAGQAVARLGGRELDAKAEGFEAQIRETQAELGLLEVGPRSEEIEVARIAAASAKDRLAYAQRRYTMDVQLLESGLVSRKAFDETEAAVAQAESERAAAQARWSQLVRGSRPEEVEAMRARLERLDTELRFVTSERQRLSILSPVSGLVATANRQLQALPGRLVAKGGLVAEVYDPESLVAAITIPEKEIADVSVGQSVVLRARAFPAEVFQGVVRSIAIVASEGGSGPSDPARSNSAAGNSGTRMFLVTATLDNRSRRLQPEMSGQAKILCGPRSIAGLVLRRLVRTFKIEVWSWW